MYLANPLPADAARAINSGKKSGVVVVVGVCEVSYSGRAAANLRQGRRLLLIKRDGTLLVHEAEKAQPKIWNPPGSSTAAYVEGERLVVKSVRQRPLETVKAVFSTIDFIGVFNVDVAELNLVGSERDIVQALVESPWLIEEGLKVVGVEVPTEAGHIDILGVDKNNVYVVIEVKRDVAGHEAVFQLRRYVEVVSRARGKARGILVAADITPSAFNYLKDYGLKFVKIKPRELMEKSLNRNRFYDTSIDVDK